MEAVLRLLIFLLRFAVELPAVSRKLRLTSLSPLILIVLICLTLLAGWLRFKAIGFGLLDQDERHLFRLDEGNMLSLSIWLGPGWNPHMAFPYPPAQIYVQNAALRTYSVL